MRAPQEHEHHLTAPKSCLQHSALEATLHHSRAGASCSSAVDFSPLLDVQNPAGLAEAPPLLEAAEARAKQDSARAAPTTEEEKDDYYKNCSFSQVMGHAQGRNDS